MILPIQSSGTNVDLSIAQKSAMRRRRRGVTPFGLGKDRFQARIVQLPGGEFDELSDRRNGVSVCNTAVDPRTSLVGVILRRILLDPRKAYMRRSRRPVSGLGRRGSSHRKQLARRFAAAVVATLAIAPLFLEAQAGAAPFPHSSHSWIRLASHSLTGISVFGWAFQRLCAS
jgi:hypothetical protein